MKATASRLDPEHVFQTPWELDTFVALVQSQAPARILEVGAWYGGTLCQWLRIADTVVVVDDEMRRASTWRDWAREEGATLHTVQGRSGQPQTIAAAQQHGPYDLVFIDADHSYAGVSADWENYGPMVAPGGMVAFHDIHERPAHHEYGVHQLWEEIKAVAGTRWVEVQQSPGPATTSDFNGIGIVWP